MSTKTSTILLTLLVFFDAGEFAVPEMAHAISSEGATSVRDLVLQTADGVAIDARLYDANNDDVIVYCHRLLSSKDGGEVDLLAGALTDEYDLLAFDFRGHKSSFGMTTVGGDEILDLRAALSFARSRGYRRTIVLGAGMGGTVGWRTAEIFGNMDALIVISPSGFSPETAPLIIGLASSTMLTTPLGRVPLRIVARTRLGLMHSAGFPLDLAALPGRIPTLIIQSEEDRFVDIKRMRIVFEGLGESGTLMIVPGRKHAEDLIDRDGLERIRAFLDGLPPREELVRVSRRGGAAGPDGSPRHSPATIRVVLEGDSPLPEDLILDELGKRISARIAAGDSAACGSRTVLRELRDIFAIHGYTRTSLSRVDSLTPFTVHTSTPRIHAVSVAGNRWVADEYIRGVVRIGGDHYNAYELDRAIRRLASQSAIQSVKSRVTARDDGDVDIHLTVTERRPYRFLLATKFTDIDDFAGIGFTWNEVNPTALRYEGRAMIGVSEHDLLTYHTLSKNLLQNTLRLGATIFDNIKSRDDLDYIFSRQEVHEIGGDLEARYHAIPSMWVTLGVFGKRYESPLASLDMPVEEGASGGVRCLFDLSSALPRRSPRFAWRYTFYYEKSGPFEIGDFSFDTYQLNLSGELKLGRNHTSRTTIHGGAQSSGAPPQDEFSLGGMTTLPAYPDDSFLGNRVALASQSLRLSARSFADETSAWSPLRLILFGDAGTVWGNGRSFSLDNLRMDAGFEFEYMEMLRAGCAWPVGNQREGSPRAYVGWGVHVL